MLAQSNPAGPSAAPQACQVTGGSGAVVDGLSPSAADPVPNFEPDDVHPATTSAAAATSARHSFLPTTKATVVTTATQVRPAPGCSSLHRMGFLRDYVAAEGDRIVATLFDWLRIPSISAHPEKAGEV